MTAPANRHRLADSANRTVGPGRRCRICRSDEWQVVESYHGGPIDVTVHYLGCPMGPMAPFFLLNKGDVLPKRAPWSTPSTRPLWQHPPVIFMTGSGGAAEPANGIGSILDQICADGAYTVTQPRAPWLLELEVEGWIKDAIDGAAPDSQP